MILHRLRLAIYRGASEWNFHIGRYHLEIYTDKTRCNIGRLYRH